MTEEQMLEAMLADAKRVRKKYKEKYGGKQDEKFLEPKPKPESKKSGGWNKINQEQIEDIRYFRNRGWCVSSTAIFVGVSNATVRKYDNRSTES